MPRSSTRKRSASARLAEIAENYSVGRSKRLHFNTDQPIARQPLPHNFATVHRLNSFTATCPRCSAKHWIEERSMNSSIRNPQFSMCCADGKVHLNAPVHPPPELERYLLNQSQGISAKDISTQNDKNITHFFSYIFIFSRKNLP
jgi:hypothetical protein